MNNRMSQLVIGQSAFSCWLNQMAKTPIGRVNFNEERWNTAFGVQDFKLDSTSLADRIKLFQEALGDNKPLVFDMTFKDISVSFGQFDVDMSIDYTLCLSVRMDLLGAKELIYDELMMRSSANVRAENDIMHIDLLEHKLNLDSRGGNRDAPKRNSMDMTTNQYREFLEDFSFTMSEMKKWLNDVVFRGDRVRFPYSLKEFQTSVQFQKNKMHVMIDVEDKAYQFLEEQLWKDDQSPFNK